MALAIVRGFQSELRRLDTETAAIRAELGGALALEAAAATAHASATAEVASVQARLGSCGETRTLMNSDLQKWIDRPPGDGSDATAVLPDEALSRVFLLLDDAKEFVRAGWVCRRWRRLVQSPALTAAFEWDVRFARYASRGHYPYDYHGSGGTAGAIRAMPDAGRPFHGTVLDGGDRVSRLLVSDAHGQVFGATKTSTIRVWSTADGRLLHTLTGHTDEVRGLAVCGDHLISGGEDQTVRVWSIPGGTLEKTLADFATLSGQDIYAVAASQQAGMVYGAGADNIICVWSTDGWRLQTTIIVDSAGALPMVGNLAVSESQQRLYATLESIKPSDNTAAISVISTQDHTELQRVKLSALYDDGWTPYILGALAFSERLQRLAFIAYQYISDEDEEAGASDEHSYHAVELFSLDENGLVSVASRETSSLLDSCDNSPVGQNALALSESVLVVGTAQTGVWIQRHGARKQTGRGERAIALHREEHGYSAVAYSEKTQRLFTANGGLHVWGEGPGVTMW